MTDTPATPDTSALSVPRSSTTSAGSPQMEQRLRLLGDAATWEEAGEEAHRAWDEPYGVSEEWELVIQDRQIPGPHGPVPVRIYTPQAATDADRPCLVWLHGGAWMHGDLDMPEGHHVARGVAGRADAVVVSVDYRLCDEPAEYGGAPARDFPQGPGQVHAPIPLDDVCAAVAWTRENARELAIDPERIAIGGASAGGNLAAAASLRLAEEGAPLAASLLLYPVAHPAMPEPTPEEAEALDSTPTLLRFLPAGMRLMVEAYLGHSVQDAVPHDFPGVATREQLSVLPRTYIEADEYDDLRISARRYAEQLREAGVEVDFTVRRGVAHGHLNRVGLAEARESMDRMGQLVRSL